MNDYEVLDLSDRIRWKDYLQKLPLEQQDIYFTPEYYELYEKNGEGKVRCFVYEKRSEVAMYPFLLNSVNDLGYDLDREYFDIQGAYGYNGILTSNSGIDFLKSFFNFFDDYCKENNIIAEFTRINPLLNNHFMGRSDFELIFDRENVNVDLSKDNIFEMEYEYSTRKNIRKAIKNNLDFRLVSGDKIANDELEIFFEIYSHTMSRNKADDFYCFDLKYFHELSLLLGKNSLWVFVSLDNKVISCELILLGNQIAYSFLGGTLDDYYQYRPNDFLKHESILYLKGIGLNNFLLGGGSEGVFRYKKSFSKNGVIPFFIGKKVHQEKIYEQVVEQWKEKYPDSFIQNNNKLLGYREI